MLKDLYAPKEFIVLGDFLTWASDYFFSNNLYYGIGVDNPWDEAVILSDPPYVNAVEIAKLTSGILSEYQYEPILALNGGLDGIKITSKIILQASNYLTENGLLLIEVGETWRALEAKYPYIDFTWPQFANGWKGALLLKTGYLNGN